MEHAFTNFDSSVTMRDENVERLMKNTNKCNQCDFTSSQVSHLRRHLNTHGREKSNKCNQCDFASYEAGSLRAHLKIHSGEKPLNEVRVGPTVFLVLAHVMWLERNMHCLHYLRLLRSYFAHVLVVPSLGQQCCIL